MKTCKHPDLVSVYALWRARTVKLGKDRPGWTGLEVAVFHCEGCGKLRAYCGDPSPDLVRVPEVFAALQAEGSSFGRLTWVDETLVVEVLSKQDYESDIGRLKQAGERHRLIGGQLSLPRAGILMPLFHPDDPRCSGGKHSLTSVYSWACVPESPVPLAGMVSMCTSCPHIEGRRDMFGELVPTEAIASRISMDQLAPGARYGHAHSNREWQVQDGNPHQWKAAMNMMNAHLQEQQ